MGLHDRESDGSPPFSAQVLLDKVNEEKLNLGNLTQQQARRAGAIFRVFVAVMRAIFWRLEYSAPSLAQMPIPSLAAFLFVRGASCSR